VAQFPQAVHFVGSICQTDRLAATFLVAAIAKAPKPTAHTPRVVLRRKFLRVRLFCALFIALCLCFWKVASPEQFARYAWVCLVAFARG
jgi:hypothetical protein